MTDFDVTPPGDEFARARLPGVADGEVGASGGDAEPGGDEGFVIEELSRRTGLTVRSLRSYQTQRLLPPPTVLPAAMLTMPSAEGKKPPRRNSFW